MKIFRNATSIAFRTKFTQECVAFLERLKYRYTSCGTNSEILPKDYSEMAIVITFDGGSYTLVKPFPSITTCEQVFEERKIISNLEDFYKETSKGEEIEINTILE